MCVNAVAAFVSAYTKKDHAWLPLAWSVLALVWRPKGPGTGLFSRGLMTPVSWALERFTAVFGMGTGGTTPLSPPGPVGRHTNVTLNS